MVKPVIVFASLVILLVLLFKPKYGAFLFWVILFLYPHGWWADNLILPWNIGFDDLFCLTFFFLIVIRRNIMEGQPIKFSIAFWSITVFTLIAIIASLAGSSCQPSVYQFLYIKDCFKFLIYWALFYSIIHSIDNVDDLKFQFKIFSLAAVVGAGTVIIHYLKPEIMLPWTTSEVFEHTADFTGRAFGSMGNPNSAACILVLTTIFLLFLRKSEQNLFWKHLVPGFIVVTIIALMMTKSRSGLLAFGATFILMAIFSKSRMTVLFVLVLGAIVAISAKGIRSEYAERIELSYSTTSGLDTNVLGRFTTWHRYLDSATLKTYMLGQGSRAGTYINGDESHSAYVSILVNYGIGGMIWAIITFFVIILRNLKLRHCSNPIISNISSACLWGMCAFMVYGVTADAISSQYSRYVLFLIIVLSDFAYQFYGQQSEYELIDGGVEFVEA